MAHNTDHTRTGHPETDGGTEHPVIAGHHGADPDALYGLVAEFDDAHHAIEAAAKVRDAGYTAIDAYSPFPVEGLVEALGKDDTKIPWLMLAGGVLGGVGGFAMLTWMVSIDYPLNIGGRPLFAWPSFIPITFELTVLCASFAGIIGMFWLNHLPMPYHAVFSTPNFERATSDRFFISIEKTDPKFELSKTRSFLEGLGAVNVSEVEERK